MFYLLLAIICSTSIALIFKYSESKNFNRYHVTTFNYVMAITVSIILTAVKWSTIVNILKSNPRVIFILLLLGLPAGLFFYLSFIYYQKSVRENGATLSGMFSKLGILIPMIVSILLWKELPTKLQWLGIFLSLAAIIIVNYEPGDKTKLKASLIFLLFYGGMAEFSNKIFQKYFVSDLKTTFLFILFLTAFLLSFNRAKKETQALKRDEMITGLMVGLPNLMSAFFLIIALDTVTTSVAFPIYSAGVIMLISLASYVIYKEKINVRGWIGIILTISALIFINI